jgi:hypothetical protein
VRGEVLSDIPDRGVRYHSDLLDAPVMIADEAKVRDQRSEALPAGKRRDFDDESPESATRLDIGVDSLGELREIGLLESRRRPYMENGILGVEVGFDHGHLRRLAIAWTSGRVLERRRDLAVALTEPSYRR